MCLEIYWLDPVHFSSTPGLAWQAALKNSKVKSDLITDTDVLWMVEKKIIGGICHAISWYAKINSKYLKDFDKKRIIIS